jgi:HSP20 family protein
MTTLVPRSTRQLATTRANRLDPAREVEELQDRLGQLVAGVFGELSSDDGRRPIWSVPADIEETDDAFIVELDLPNVRSQDVNVELRDNELRVSGEYKRKERKDVLRRQMRRVGEFEYVIALPGQLDPDNVDASLADGTLTVREESPNDHGNADADRRADPAGHAG